MRSLLAVLIAITFLNFCGCHRYYDATTVLNADGSVVRTITQPGDEGAQGGACAKGWAKIEEIDRTSGGGGVPSREGHKPYFTASAHFDSPGAIPEHFLRPTDEALKYGVPQARLVRQYARRDWELVIEHDWSETLTDTVTFDGMRKARDELLDLGADLGMEVFDAVLGKEYDAAELAKWLRTEGRAFVADLTDTAFVEMLGARSRGGPLREGAMPDPRIIAALVDVCDRHGLHLRAGGGPLDEKRIEGATREFIVSVASRTVRRRDNGKPVDRETVLAWWNELKADDEPKEGQPPPPVNRFKAAAMMVGLKHGGPEALKRRALPLAANVAGVYWPDVMTNLPFDYTMTVPGEIVWTNGETTAPDVVRWRFDGRAAWPLGYDMGCRSLVPDPDHQRAIPGAAPLTTRADMLEYVSLVGAPLDGAPATRPATRPVGPDHTLLDAVRTCVERRATRPLYDYRDHIPAGDAHDTEAARVDRLLALLKLPPAVHP